MKSINFKWYVKEIDKQYFEKWICGPDGSNSSYTILEEIGKGLGKKIKIGFLSTKIPLDALEVTDIETLRKIRMDRIRKNISPLPEINIAEF